MIHHVLPFRYLVDINTITSQLSTISVSISRQSLLLNFQFIAPLIPASNYNTPFTFSSADSTQRGTSEIVTIILFQFLKKERCRRAPSREELNSVGSSPSPKSTVYTSWTAPQQIGNLIHRRYTNKWLYIMHGAVNFVLPTSNNNARSISLLVK